MFVNEVLRKDVTFVELGILALRWCFVLETFFIVGIQVFEGKAIKGKHVAVLKIKGPVLFAREWNVLTQDKDLVFDKDLVLGYLWWQGQVNVVVGSGGELFGQLDYVSPLENGE